MAKRLLALFLFGAIVIAIFDGFHTHSGTTRYAAPVFLMAAWWTPLVFGLSTGVGGPAYAMTYRTLGGKREPPPWVWLVPAFALWGGLYYFSGFYKGPNEVKLAVLGASAVAFWLVLDRTLAGAIAAIITAIVGPLCESAQVHAGWFEHLQPDFLGVPMWLPALYAASGPVIGQGARRWLNGPASS
jgi:hypothetical protein